MNQFIVSALKNRPKSFEEVIGQDSITHTLKNSLKTNQLPQALLFSGPRGVGKTTCARILAKQINNLETKNSEDYSFNIFELDAASNNSVEDIRKINEQVRIPPQIGKYKVYIIDEAHMLSNSAFNAFLKTLEEPPKHIVFILATTEKNKIIPTILSRCQIYDFKRISVIAIQSYLKKIALESKFKFEENALFLIAQKAEGSLRDALSIYDRMVSFTKADLNEKSVADNLNLLDNETYCDLGKIIFNNNIPQLIKSYDILIKRGIEDIQFINGLGDYFRNLILAKDPKTLKLLEVGEELKFEYTRITKKLFYTKILEALELINKSEIDLKNVKNKRVHVELTLMKIASIDFKEKKKNSLTENPLKSPISSEEIENLPLETDFKKNNLDDVSKNLIQKQKNENSLKPSVEIELPDNGKETAYTDNLLKDKNQKKISSYSLSSVKLKRTITHSNKKKQDNNGLPEDSFKHEDLEKVLNEYISQLKKEGKQNIISILNMNPVKLEDKNSVIFTVANEMNRVEINIEKEKLLPYIQKKLRNYKIKIKISVDEVIKEEIIFSPKEKYQHLLKINPSLEILRKTFDLEY
tara:strand:+ start:169 stop:1917 length:1749 start_codon:yes stop_codon:yes gene_type:complete